MKWYRSIGSRVLTLTFVLTLMASAAWAAGSSGFEVFWVRHAEKELVGSDPALTDPGKERALALASLLADSGISAIHSSDYARTRQTAAPLAELLGLEVELYDPRDLPALVEDLRARGGRHLVVGHSNTTPVGVELMGGQAGEPIVEATEYDRLYLVSVGGDGQVRTVLLRYGTPTVPTSRGNAGPD